MGTTAVDGTRSHRAGRAGAALVAVATLAGIAGLWLAVDGAVARARVVTAVGRSGGLRLEVSRAEWVAHEMEPMPGMAAAGMPKDGYTRLHLEVTVRNEGTAARAITPGEFGLEAGRQRWDLATTSLVTGAVWPGQALAGDLFFDVPTGETDRPLRLGWRPPGPDVLFRLDDALGNAPHADDGHDEGEERP